MRVVMMTYSTVEELSVLIVSQRLPPGRIMLANIKDRPVLKCIRLRVEGSSGGHCNSFRVAVFPF